MESVMSRSDRILLTLGLLGSVVAASAVTIAVPRLYVALVNSDFDLPPAGYLLAKYYLAAWLLPALVLGLLFVLPKRRWRVAVASAPGLVALLLLISVAGLTYFYPVSVTI